MVEPMDRWAEVESGIRLEAKARDYPAMMTMEDGRPTELATYKWLADR